EIKERRKRKIIIDFIFLYFQSGLFYLVAISLNDFPKFLGFFLILFVFDVFWFIILGVLKAIKFNKTYIQWLISDIILGVFAGIILILLADNSRCEITFSNSYAIVLIFFTVFDLWINYEYYFGYNKDI
ncbi:unnamed protein product, partial [marine sediment metagenome]